MGRQAAHSHPQDVLFLLQVGWSAGVGGLGCHVAYVCGAGPALSASVWLHGVWGHVVWFKYGFHTPGREYRAPPLSSCRFCRSPRSMRV